ncbi:MAG: hypothetical protein ACYSR1_09285 [Planctomycetota bacterium]
MAKRNINLNTLGYKYFSMSIMGICGVCLFIYLGIIPLKKSNASLYLKIQNIQLKIDSQETLLPVYRLLKERLLVDDHRALPFPEQVCLPQGQTDEIFVEFRKKAKKFNMELLSIVPDLVSMDEKSRFLKVSLIFVNFLLQWGQFRIWSI